MPYLNLASATKLRRATQIITDIGSGGFMLLYTGTPPASPDISDATIRAGGTLLLASLPLTSVAGVASLTVQQAIITAPGTAGNDGTYFLSFSGDGSGAAGFYIVVGGKLETITITDHGQSYTSAPSISGFGAAGLSNASALAIMTGMMMVRFAEIPISATNTGMIGWARVSKADRTGIIDLDVGTTNAASVVVDNIFVSAGTPVTCSTNVLIEA